MQRTDEIGLILRSIRQLGLICRWLIKDVSEQVDNVRKGSESLVSDCHELETHTQRTVGYMQQNRCDNEPNVRFCKNECR